MKLTTKSEYSLLALLYMARHDKDTPVKISAICAQYNISKKYLEQLCFILKQNHLIVTKRGKQGGYALARPANKIFLAEVIRLMDGALAPVESASKFFYSKTPLENEKNLIKVFKEIRDLIAQRMESLTIADFL